MKHLLTALLFFALSLTMAAQTPLRPVVTFDGTEQNNWTFSARTAISMNGKADGTPNWAGRPAIASASGNQALLMEGQGGEELTFLTSPFLNFPAGQNVFLHFHQYYRNFRGVTRIDILNDGQLLRTIPINDLLAEGVETAHFDTLQFDLTTDLAGQANRQVRFTYTGQSYFWLLDDIGFYDAPHFPETSPADTMGNYLAAQGYPYKVDSAGWAYVPNELVVQFSADATEPEKEDIREEFGAFVKDSCACNQIELWVIDGSRFLSQGGRVDIGGSTNIQSNGLGVKKKTKIDGVDLNYYNGTILEPMIPIPNDSLTTDSLRGLPASKDDALRIAILDTGIDYKHSDLSQYVAVRQDGLSPDDDADGNCLENDPIGWNFIDDNNNPFDDNSHGTHVAGIIAGTLERYASNDCNFEFVPYKTHDYNGVSTLYSVACATFQASIDEIDIINDSWGFFGDSSTVLRNAIDTAEVNNILIVSAAGNDSINLGNQAQYPACYSAPNLITVGALRTDGGFPGNGGPLRGGARLEFYSEPALFTNFDDNCVDIMAPGTDIESTVPGGGYAEKDGTSMATPMVAGVAAAVLCQLSLSGERTIGYAEVRDTILDAAEPNTFYEDFSTNGRQLRIPDTLSVAITNLAPEAGFRAFPNPSAGELVIESLASRKAEAVSLLTLDGREVFRSGNLNWISAGDQQTLTLPELPAGIYFLRILGKDYQWTQKIIRY
ncbi:S8 family peptidase [Neolewinella agarilytica]|uniref:Por secretion system C-terminal sorting domain-containing protein n=1 Tax=Neolewinella agarilytica TaxID=478744 RepID=A0A1H9MN16_9BACT|nr:S8 family peptidase [Neolewinella agarilytica]SER24961.1 Por secretion system C-terminal sorting domain-containing protein [Neolewinella agarilytica]